MNARYLLALLAYLSACRASGSGEGTPFQERILATIPEGVEFVGPPAFTPDGREVAYIARTGDDYRAVRGDWKSRRLDAM